MIELTNFFVEKLVFEDNSEEIKNIEIAKNSICNIYDNDNDNDNIKKGTGFFCQIPDPQNENKTMIALFTCNHVIPIDNDNFNNIKTISFQLNNREKESLCLKDGRRIWVDKAKNISYGNLDYTCIEIFPTISNFLNCLKKNKEELKIFKIEKEALNGQDPQKLEKKEKKEIINYIFREKNNNYTTLTSLNSKIKFLDEKTNKYFYYDLDTKEGDSGSPIIEKNGNIIGIHTGKRRSNNTKDGEGVFFRQIYNHMKENEPIISNEVFINPQKTQLYQKGNYQLKKKNCCIIILIILSIIAVIIFIIGNSKNKSPKNLINYFQYFFDSTDKNYEPNIYYNNSCKINETGNYRICAYGAEANPGGKGGKVCVNIEYLKKNDIIEYSLGGREAGGKRGENCGSSKGKGHNGAGMALVKYKNKKNKIVYLIAGGGGGNSESDNKGGDSEEDGNGFFKGKKAEGKNPGTKGDEYAKDGTCQKEEGKGGKGGEGGEGGGEIKTPGKWCGGGGGDGYCGGGGGGWGDPPNAGGGGGGSNYCSYDYENEEFCSFGNNKKNQYSGIKIHKLN